MHHTPPTKISCIIRHSWQPTKLVLQCLFYRWKKLRLREKGPRGILSSSLEVSRWGNWNDKKGKTLCPEILSSQNKILSLSASEEEEAGWNVLTAEGSKEGAAGIPSVWHIWEWVFPPLRFLGNPAVWLVSLVLYLRLPLVSEYPPNIWHHSGSIAHKMKSWHLKTWFLFLFFCMVPPPWCCCLRSRFEGSLILSRKHNHVGSPLLTSGPVPFARD